MSTFTANVLGLNVDSSITVVDPSAANEMASKNYVDTSASNGVLYFAATSTSNSDTTQYIWPASGSAASTTEVGILIPAAGKISKLYVKATTGPASDSIVFTVRNNAVSQTLTATLAAAATTANDTTHSFTVAAGDEVTVQANPGASISSGAVNVRIGLEYTIG